MMYSEEQEEEYNPEISSSSVSDAETVLEEQVTMAIPVLQHVPFPDKLELKEDCTKFSDWEILRQMWDNYEISSGLDGHTMERRTATLLTCFAPSALKVFNSLSFSAAEDKKDISKVLQKMSDFCKGITNETYERYLFNVRGQGAGESIDDFYGALLHLSKNCNFGELRNSLIRDRIIVGVKDVAVRKRLLQKQDLTLEVCMQISRSFEATDQQLQSMQKKDAEVSFVKKHRKPQRKHSSASASSEHPSSKKTSNNSKKCYCCGQQRHPRSQCPAKNAVCSSCGKKGHYKAVCRSSKAVQEVTYESSEEDGEFFLGAVHEGGKDKWNTQVQVDGKNVMFKVDTGADVDVISGELYRELFAHKILLPSTKVLRGPDKKSLHVLGYFKAKLKKAHTISSDIFIINGATSLLGRNSSEALGLVAFVGSIEDYPQLFKGLGEMPQSYNIKLDSTVKPFAVAFPRRIALPLMSKVKEELDRLETLHVIRRITQPTDWCAPIVVVPKNQGKLRICVDFTKLNLAVKRERHILPSVDHALGQMAGASMLSKLDANSGFHQVKLTKECQELTTFITPFGRYCYERLPFGINSGPEHYQRQVHRILEDCPGVVCLMDDIVVFGASKEEHNERLDNVLDKLSRAGITLNREKCEFHKSELKFLGHIIGKDGIKADPEKVAAVMEMQEPTNITELRRFFGMINQLAKFVQDLVCLTEPLRPLLSVKTAWMWGDEQSAAFKKVKEKLCTSPVLALYDPSRETKVAADSSSYGLGAVLLQNKAEEWHPVAFASRSLTLK